MNYILEGIKLTAIFILIKVTLWILIGGFAAFATIFKMFHKEVIEFKFCSTFIAFSLVSIMFICGMDSEFCSCVKCQWTKATLVSLRR